MSSFDDIARLKRQFGGAPPLATVLRVAASLVVAVAVARLVPGEGKVTTLAALILAGLVFLIVLILLREFGPEDRAKFARILGKRSGR